MNYFKYFQQHRTCVAARQSRKKGIFISRTLKRGYKPTKPLLKGKNTNQNKLYWYSCKFLKELTSRALRLFISYWDKASEPENYTALPYFNRAAFPLQGNVREKANGIYFLCQNESIVYIGKCSRFWGRISKHKSEGIKEFDRAIFFPSKTFRMLENLFIGLLQPKYNIAAASDWEIGIFRRGFIKEALNVWLFLFQEGCLGANAQSNFLKAIANACTKEPTADKTELRAILAQNKAVFERLGVLIPEKYCAPPALKIAKLRIS